MRRQNVCFCVYMCAVEREIGDARDRPELKSLRVHESEISLFLATDIEFVDIICGFCWKRVLEIFSV
jgi:hypothetical protein